MIVSEVNEKLGTVKIVSMKGVNFKMLFYAVNISNRIVSIKGFQRRKQTTRTIEIINPINLQTLK